MSTRTDLLETVRDKREDILRIARQHGASDVRVFGSAVRGQECADSDIDFLVRFAPGVTLLDHAAMLRELEDLLGRKVDVVSERALRQRIRDQVLREAVTV